MRRLIHSFAAALLAATATLAVAAPGAPIIGTTVSGCKKPCGTMREQPAGKDGTAPVAAATPGSPIGGLVVKGGQNPHIVQSAPPRAGAVPAQSATPHR